MGITVDRTYTTVDKSDWGPGPWQDEPDKLQWVDEASGLDCLIVRNRLGALCGYVGVSPEHPWHGVHYDGEQRSAAENMKIVTLEEFVSDEAIEEDGDRYERSPEGRCEVHGGLTYSNACQEDAPEAEGICHVPPPGRSADVWWFGFDCAHSGDVVPGMEARERGMGLPPIRDDWSTYKTVGYVQRECARLAEQLAASARSAEVVASDEAEGS